MIEVNICVGSSCHLKGSYKVIRTLEKLIAEASLKDRIEMKARFCMQQCQVAVAVTVGEELYSVSPEETEAFFRDVLAKAAAG